MWASMPSIVHLLLKFLNKDKNYMKNHYGVHCKVCIESLISFKSSIKKIFIINLVVFYITFPNILFTY